MRKSLSLFVFSVIALFLSPSSLPAQDAVGCKDHPLLSRMPNFYIQDCEEKDFDSLSIYDASGSEVSIEGKKTYISHVIKEGAKAPSDLQILRNFETALLEAGGKTESMGPHDLYMSLEKAGREVWVHVHSWNDGEGYDLTILEKQAMVQDISASDMFDALNRDGFITLYINFDTGKATIKPDSKPIIEQVTKLLQDNPSLNVSIEGHTDSTGTPAKNKTLSEERALSVVDALAASGIDKNRLSAIGWGQEKPIADNGTEEGRAKNRRVEIVKK